MLAHDALSVDGEVEAHLRARCEQICTQASGQVGLFQPELKALVRGVMWYLALDDEATPGQALMGLHQAAGDALGAQTLTGRALDQVPRGQQRCVSRRRSLLHGVLLVLLPWVWARLSQLIMDPAHPERLRWLRWMRRAEGMVALGSLAAALHHLHWRRFPTLTMALAGIQLLPALPAAPRRPDFYLLEQQARGPLVHMRVPGSFSVPR